MIRTTLTTLQRTALVWANGPNNSHLAWDAAVKFLYGRPRPWVKQIAQCVMRRSGLEPGEFITLFVRDSVE